MLNLAPPRLAAKAILSAALCLSAASLHAADYTWTGNDSNTWGSASANWSPQGIPSADDTATFGNVDSGQRRVVLGGSPTVKSLEIAQSSNANNWLRIAGYTLTVTDKIILRSTATNGAGRINFEIGGNGTLVSKRGVEVKTRSRLTVSTADNQIATVDGDLAINNFGVLSFYRAGRAYGIFNVTGSLTVSANGYFNQKDLAGHATAARKITLGGNLTANQATIYLNLVDDTYYDQFVGNGANSFSIRNSRLVLQVSDNFDYSKSYTIFNNFASGSAANITVSGNYDSENWQARLSEAGILSFVPADQANGAPATGTGLSQWQARPSPEWLTQGVIYQIQPRAFTAEGTLKAAEARLPQLAELGVSVLYLCPVFVADDDLDQDFWSPRQKRSGMNNPRNPYRIKDFYHVDAEYGTDQDLKDFIDAAHALGMRVLLDLVYLHAGPTAVFAESNPDFFKRAPDGGLKNAEWSFPALNFDNPELREYLWKNMEWWIRDFNVDGFRCDVSGMIPLDFWEEGRARVEHIRPDVGMLAESVRKEDQLQAFDLNYGWGNAITQLQDGVKVREEWTKMRDERPIGGAKFARFIDNHDVANDDYENRLEKRWGTQRVNAALVWLFTMDGVPFIYNGQEIADTTRHTIFGRMPINWSQAESQTGRDRLALVKELIALRDAEPALTEGELVWLDNDQPKAVSAFTRTLGSSQIISLINLSEAPVTVALEQAEGTYEPLLNYGAKSDKPGTFELAPHGYFVGKQIIQ